MLILRNNLSKLLFIVVFSVLLLSACSFKFVYQQLDYLLISYIDDFVTLNESQTVLLEQRIQKSLSWHQKTQLPIYAEWLVSVRNDIEKGLDKTNVTTHVTTIESLTKDVLVRLADDIRIVLLDLSKQQIQQTLANIAEKNTEFHETYVDKNNEELKQQELEKIIERFENWLGDLTKPQYLLLTQFVNQSALLYEQRYQSRLKWQKYFSFVLIKKTKLNNLKSEINTLLFDSEKFKSKDFLQKSNKRKQAFIRLIVAISKTLSVIQKQHLFEKMQDYKAMFLELNSEFTEDIIEQ